MRITGGLWRSRRVLGPSRGMTARPTPDALRERGFQVLGDHCEGAVVLDLFAGTGVVGLEALSRGATRAVFVDRDPRSVRLIRRNLERFPEADGRVEVLRLDAAAAVRRLARRGETFDLVWSDPPFDAWQVGADALASACAGGLVRGGGRLCLECPERADLGEISPPLIVDRDLAGGASRLVLVSCGG